MAKCFHFLLWLLVFFTSSHGCLAEDLSQYTLKDLRGGQSTSLAALPGDVVAVMFFEPECIWCRKQAQVLKHLHQQCNKVAPVALGVNGDRIFLKKALFNMQFPFPGYLAPNNLVNDLGGIPATPITLLLQNQQLVGVFRGYKSIKTIAEATGCAKAQ